MLPAAMEIRLAMGLLWCVQMLFIQVGEEKMGHGGKGHI